MAIERMCRTEEIEEELKAEEKRGSLNDKPNYYILMEKLNKELEELKRLNNLKLYYSEQSANVILMNSDFIKN